MLSNDPINTAQKAHSTEQVVQSDQQVNKSTLWLQKALAAKDVTFDRILDGSLFICDLVAKSLQKKSAYPALTLAIDLNSKFSRLSSDQKLILANLSNAWMERQSGQVRAESLLWDRSIPEKVRVIECSIARDSLHISIALPDTASGVMVYSDTIRFLARRPDGNASGYIPRVNSNNEIFSLLFAACNPQSHNRSEAVLLRINTEKINIEKEIQQPSI